jgi:hypothetical protein
LRADYPGWQITRPLEAILEELATSLRQPAGRSLAT